MYIRAQIVGALKNSNAQITRIVCAQEIIALRAFNCIKQLFAYYARSLARAGHIDLINTFRVCVCTAPIRIQYFYTYVLYYTHTH